MTYNPRNYPHEGDTVGFPYVMPAAARGPAGPTGHSGAMVLGYSGATGTSGYGTSGYSGIGTSGYSGSGYSGLGVSGYSGFPI